jgi:alpha-glucuronidase
MRGRHRRLGILLVALLAAPAAWAEDGYELWLRYPRVSDAALLKEYQSLVSSILVAGESPTSRVAREELTRGIRGLLGVEVPLVRDSARDGVIVAGTPATSTRIAGLNLGADLHPLGDEGFLIRSMRIGGRRATVIAANADIGVLYGTFHFLRLLQTHQRINALAVIEAPRIRRRVLDHWDNLDGTVERGYAGASLWDWHKLPDYRAPRYQDYARANASIGINGTVLTNVNANAASLTGEYLVKAAALADVFRPYGIRVYLTARFSAPIEIGGLKTADPLAPDVKAWWARKADEIYKVIPDFGGFLVKANSEGQPGPQDYGRAHADGANMLADALASRGGIVMWRAFVYAESVTEDRAKQAYTEFQPLDGSFRPNVLIQVKNGPIDFQPREPIHPLFGAMPRTPLILEVQITKEYLGFATHLVYLAPLFEEVLRADTHAEGDGSLVRRVIDGSLHRYAETGIAGEANTGSDRNWCGSAFACANWHAFGRLAWDPSLASTALADEWLRMTFSNAPAFIEPVKAMMLASRQAAVDYMTPLRLHHQMARGHHYGPGPWVSGGSRADWTSVYYHRADASGIGFDRTVTGSNAAGGIDTAPRDLRQPGAGSRGLSSLVSSRPVGPANGVRADPLGGTGAPLLPRGRGRARDAGDVANACRLDRRRAVRGDACLPRDSAERGAVVA